MQVQRLQVIRVEASDMENISSEGMVGLCVTDYIALPGLGKRKDACLLP